MTLRHAILSGAAPAALIGPVMEQGAEASAAMLASTRSARPSSLTGTKAVPVQAGFTDIGQVRVVHSGGNTAVRPNLTGGVTPEMRITLSGQHTLTADDVAL